MNLGIQTRFKDFWRSFVGIIFLSLAIAVILIAIQLSYFVNAPWEIRSMNSDVKLATVTAIAANSVGLGSTIEVRPFPDRVKIKSADWMRLFVDRLPAKEREELRTEWYLLLGLIPLAFAATLVASRKIYK